uniref:Uncharacterized protein n=1 Tax=uncultured marine microorganism HF4000_APKG10H11 TaxID=455559 RepID=B3TC51_9ZZZZ|nr:hypothetical protein ALOHA_HF4000APKG10H11ctg1g21 [uncultured marine microorganism HF4000_APKG10H11]
MIIAPGGHATSHAPHSIHSSGADIYARAPAVPTSHSSSSKQLGSVGHTSKQSCSPVHFSASILGIAIHNHIIIRSVLIIIKD